MLTDSITCWCLSYFFLNFPKIFSKFTFLKIIFPSPLDNSPNSFASVLIFYFLNLMCFLNTFIHSFLSVFVRYSRTFPILPFLVQTHFPKISIYFSKLKYPFLLIKCFHWTMFPANLTFSSVPKWYCYLFWFVLLIFQHFLWFFHHLYHEYFYLCYYFASIGCLSFSFPTYLQVPLSFFFFRSVQYLIVK